MTVEPFNGREWEKPYAAGRGEYQGRGKAEGTRHKAQGTRHKAEGETLGYIVASLILFIAASVYFPTV